MSCQWYHSQKPGGEGTETGTGNIDSGKAVELIVGRQHYGDKATATIEVFDLKGALNSQPNNLIMGSMHVDINSGAKNQNNHYVPIMSLAFHMGSAKCSKIPMQRFESHRRTYMVYVDPLDLDSQSQVIVCDDSFVIGLVADRTQIVHCIFDRCYLLTWPCSDDDFSAVFE